MKWWFGRISVAFVLLSSLSVLAFADSVAFTDLGSGPLYDQYVGMGIEGKNVSPFGPYQAIALGFTASLGGSLSQIDLGLSNMLGPNTAEVRLYKNLNGGLGSLLFSQAVSNQPSFGLTGSTLVSLQPTSGNLFAGSNYFLVVAPGSANTLDVWNLSNTVSGGTVLADFGNGFAPTTKLLGFGAFDVKVRATPVPEPSVWFMLGMLIICWICTIAIAPSAARK